MRILLLSAYDAESHRYWREQLVSRFPEHEWVVLHLPARHFSWRVRGNAMQWVLGNSEELSGDYNLLIATSMVDLATLKGLQPNLAAVPSVLYFHENQFAYPQSERQQSLLDAQLCSVYSALAANVLVFNSDHNRATFEDGAEQLLKRLPDKLAKPVSRRIAAKTSVLPVPLLEPPEVTPRACSGEALQLLWNHRWEHDKGPELLLAIARECLSRGPRCVFHVVGQQFRRRAEAFDELLSLLRSEQALGAWGFLPRAEYRALLGKADVVLSTASHDFQGLSILEAVQAGCRPLVPDALAYPEYFSSEFRYIPGDATSAVNRLLALASEPPDVPDVSFLEWPSQRTAYDSLITSAALL